MGEYIGTGEEIPSSKVARIENLYYETLQDAINAVPNNNELRTVYLLKNIEENVKISEQKNIELDLSGYTIRNHGNIYAIEILGNVTIKNGSVNGSYTEATYGVINIGKEGQCEMTEQINVNVDQNANTIYNEGVLRISGTAEITGATQHPTISNAGQVFINGGRISSSTSNVVVNYEGGIMQIGGTAVISGTANGQATVGNLRCSRSKWRHDK